MDSATLVQYMNQNTGAAFSPASHLLHVYASPDGHRAQLQNGRYTVDAPTTLPMMTVHVGKLHAAISACKGADPGLSISEGGNLTVTAGRIRARIALSDPGAYTTTTPDPETSHKAPGVAELLARLQPFVATDASRPWATSVCISGGHAYATNNVILVREPFPATFDVPVNLPLNVFDAIITKGEPVGLGASESSMTFYFEDGTWIRSQLVVGEWPTGVVDRLIEATPGDGWAEPHEELSEVLATATKISDDRLPVVEFVDGGVRLLDHTFEAIPLGPVPADGKIATRMASIVFNVATAVQWHTPKRDVHAFRCGALQGVFGGQR